MTVIAARPLTPGSAKGPLALFSAPLSLWGGFDIETGAICDVTHPQHGLSLSGKVIAMTAARGSSSSSSALVEAVRRGTAPAAIILGRIDPILVIGSLVAADLYDREVAILLVDAANWSGLIDGAEVAIIGQDAGALLIIETGDAV